MNRRLLRNLAIMLLLLAFSPGVAPLSSPPAASQPAASSRSVTAQAAFECQGYAKGIPPERISISFQYVLNVPTSVQPGQQVSIGGTATIQMSEEARQRANTVGVDSFEVLSTDLSLVVTMAGQRKLVFSPRWETGRTAVGNPLVASGPISFPAFTVPENATGEIQLQMPQNGTVPTPVPNGSPARVAWSYRAKYYGGMLDGTEGEAGCYSPSTNPPVFTKIPVAAAGAPPGSSAPPAGTGSSDEGQIEIPAGTDAVDGGITEPGAGPAAGPGPAKGAPGAEVPPGFDATMGTGQQRTAGAPPADGPVDPTDRDGIYVSTPALVLAGFLICVGSLAYAALSGYRLQSIRKSLDK